MARYAVFSISDGSLQCTSSQVEQPLPEGLAFALVPSQQLNEEWDPVAHTFVVWHIRQYVDAMGKSGIIKLAHDPTDQDLYNAIFPYVSKLQLRRLFTFAERSAMDNIAGSGLPAQTIANIVTIKADLAAADFISLQDPLTIQAITMIEQLGLIPSGRSTQILSGQLPQ